jgi:hypothetical protein
MTVYDVVLFAHITAAILVFASLTVDWLAVAGLCGTWTAEQGRNPASPALTCGNAWQVLGSNQRRLSRRFNSTLLPAPSHAH